MSISKFIYINTYFTECYLKNINRQKSWILILYIISNLNKNKYILIVYHHNNINNEHIQHKNLILVII